jgi:hypothetical protein
VNRLIWWASLALIGAAAAGTTAWSLYVVAHDIFGMPGKLAMLTGAVYDGAAVACLNLANQATQERRSALAPHAATIALAGVSVYLNRLHALHISGGLGATLLFAAPTVALLLVSGLAWSATRARLRADDGDRPVTLPHYGAWGWLLATTEAWTATKERAVTHVTSTDTVRTTSGQRPDKPRDATSALRAHFASLDPTEAIRIAASAKPSATPAALAEELAVYGVHVTPVAVALVLGQRPPEVRVERPDTSGQPPVMPPPGRVDPELTSTDNAPDLTGQRPASIADAVRQLVERGVLDRSIVVDQVTRAIGRPDKADSVRRAFDREMNRRGDGVGKGGGGYA